MTHAEKVAYFLEDMRRRVAAPGVAAPLLFRLAWALGLKTPPPLFLSFWANFLWASGLIALLALGIQALLVRDRPIDYAAFGTVITLAVAAGFGAAAAALWRWHARRRRLPPWNDYPPPEKLGAAANAPSAPSP